MTISDTLDGRTTVTCHAFYPHGITVRELYHWTTQGFLLPENPNPGSGRRMRWPADEVRVARLMRLLIDEADMRPRGAARAAREHGRLAPGIRLLVDRKDLQI